jgi:hypothetical protein
MERKSDRGTDQLNKTFQKEKERQTDTIKRDR